MKSLLCAYNRRCHVGTQQTITYDSLCWRVDLNEILRFETANRHKYDKFVARRKNSFLLPHSPREYRSPGIYSWVEEWTQQPAFSPSDLESCLQKGYKNISKYAEIIDLLHKNTFRIVIRTYLLSKKVPGRPSSDNRLSSVTISNEQIKNEICRKYSHHCRDH